MARLPARQQQVLPGRDPNPPVYFAGALKRRELFPRRNWAGRAGVANQFAGSVENGVAGLLASLIVAVDDPAQNCVVLAQMRLLVQSAGGIVLILIYNRALKRNCPPASEITFFIGVLRNLAKGDGGGKSDGSILGPAKASGRDV